MVRDKLCQVGNQLLASNPVEGEKSKISNEEKWYPVRRQSPGRWLILTKRHANTIMKYCTTKRLNLVKKVLFDLPPMNVLDAIGNFIIGL